MKKFCQYIRGLQYNLRVVDIIIDKPSSVFEYNQSLLSYTS